MNRWTVLMALMAGCFFLGIVAGWIVVYYIATNNHEQASIWAGWAICFLSSGVYILWRAK